jgi:hypothetical protein
MWVPSERLAPTRRARPPTQGLPDPGAARPRPGAGNHPRDQRAQLAPAGRGGRRDHADAAGAGPRQSRCGRTRCGFAHAALACGGVRMCVLQCSPGGINQEAGRWNGPARPFPHHPARAGAGRARVQGAGANAAASAGEAAPAPRALARTPRHVGPCGSTLLLAGPAHEPPRSQIPLDSSANAWPDTTDSIDAFAPARLQPPLTRTRAGAALVGR